MPAVPSITLNNGVAIPQFGFGVFQVPPDETAQAVHHAFEAGYRHIDTAQMYGNEAGVGQAVRESGLPRDEVFVTTKLNNDKHGYDEAIAAVGESLRVMGLEQVDLLLIHWPQARQDRYVESWKAFEKLLADGVTRAIGVSNFHRQHLDRLAAETGTVPAVDQIEVHPALVNADLRALLADRDIAVEAYSPIAQGEVLGDERITGLAQQHGKSAAQIVLRWHVQLGNIVFPKSTNPARMRENIDVFDFELSAADVATIESLDAHRRTGLDPDEH